MTTVAKRIKHVLLCVHPAYEAYRKVTEAIHTFQNIRASNEVKKIEKDLVGIQDRLLHEINFREV